MKPFFDRQMGNGYIKIVGRNHILPPLGIENTFIYAKQIQNNASLLKGICCVKRFDYECSLFSG
jgi:hypothetical protein